MQCNVCPSADNSDGSPHREKASHKTVWQNPLGNCKNVRQTYKIYFPKLTKTDQFEQCTSSVWECHKCLMTKMSQMYFDKKADYRQDGTQTWQKWSTSASEILTQRNNEQCFSRADLDDSVHIHLFSLSIFFLNFEFESKDYVNFSNGLGDNSFMAKNMVVCKVYVASRKARCHNSSLPDTPSKRCICLIFITS